MNHIQQSAADELRAIAAREHKFLAEASSKDGFTLAALETSTTTDSVFEAWFSLVLQGKTVYFTFSLGFDPDTDRYSPYVDVTGGDDDNPIEFDNRHIASTAVGQNGLLEAVELLGREAGEARVKAFQWLESIALRAAESTDISNNT